jgi:hypothetical protein
MVNAGDAEAKRTWDRVLAGLTRKQDRLAFDLEPLPEPGPDDQRPVNPPTSDPMEAAVARRQKAVEAWQVGQSEQNRIEVGRAIAGVEKLTGTCWENVKAGERVGWGLGDRPGQLLEAS